MFKFELIFFIYIYKVKLYNKSIREVYDYFCGSGAMTIYYIQIGGSNIAYEDAILIDKIVEEKRDLNPWKMVKDTHEKGKAWDLIYRNGLGYKEVIPKRLIAENG